MFIVGIAFSVLGYTLLYYGIGMSRQYSDSSGHARPWAIPLSVLLGVRDFSAPPADGVSPHPPFKVGGNAPNQAHPIDNGTGSPQTLPAPSTGSGGVRQV